MFGIYITHPQITIDPALPVPRWHLSEKGCERAAIAARSAWAAKIARIVTSDETKAIETADILATASGVVPEICLDMCENDRSATGFLVPEEFEKAADWFFANPTESFRGWERAVDAQARIVAAVEAVLADHDPAFPVAFVGHGGVGTLLKCHLSRTAIARRRDQSAGGGQLFAFDLADRAPACDWTAMETWEGLSEWQARTG